MNGTWSFYHKETGEILPARFIGSESLLKVNTPVDHVPIGGAVDHKRYRFDLQASALVEISPPTALIEDADENLRDDLARQRIASLERSQLRSIRELLLDPNSEDAKAQLQAIDAQISAVRKDLKRGKPK